MEIDKELVVSNYYPVRKRIPLYDVISPDGFYLATIYVIYNLRRTDYNHMEYERKFQLVFNAIDKPSTATKNLVRMYFKNIVDTLAWDLKNQYEFNEERFQTPFYKESLKLRRCGE